MEMWLKKHASCSEESSGWCFSSKKGLTTIAEPTKDDNLSAGKKKQTAIHHTVRLFETYNHHHPPKQNTFQTPKFESLCLKKQAVVLFKQNISNHPWEWNMYQHLAWMYGRYYGKYTSPMDAMGYPTSSTIPSQASILDTSSRFLYHFDRFSSIPSLPGKASHFFSR